MPAAAVAAGAYGLSGDRLPYSIPWSGGITVNQSIPLSSGWTGFAEASVAYVGLRYGEFAYNSVALRAQFPAYARTDLSIGARFDSWRFNWYVNNVGDRRGIAGAVSSLENGNYYGAIIQPLTVGFGAVRTF